MPTCGTCTAYARGCRCEACKEARREYDKQRYAANAEENRRRKAQRYAENGAEIRRRVREARLVDVEAARERERQQYAANREKKAQHKREARAADVERARAMANDWRRRTGKGRQYSANRRALKLNAFVEDVDPLVVFEKDDYVCQMCRRNCPRDAKWPRAEAATLDHIVPLANGGEHSYANAQTLCFRCNTSKGNRPIKTPPVSDAGRNDAVRVTTVATN